MGLRSLALVASLAALSCSRQTTDDVPPVTTSTCDSRVQLDGVCPGAPSAALCEGDPCTSSVTCSAVHKVSSASELSTAASSAVAGSCIALAAGTYAATVDVPAGVSLLGRGASLVTVTGVRIKGGPTASTISTIRGLTVGAEGILAESAGTVTVDSIIIQGTTFGLWAIDTNLSMTKSSVVGGSKFGVLAQCKASCTALQTVTIKGVRVDRAKTVGIWLRGVASTLSGVSVSNVEHVQFGRGIEVVDGTFTATGLSVAENQGGGIFVDGAVAKLDSVLALRNSRGGIQLQHTPAVGGAELSRIDVRDNKGVGIGIDGGAKGIIIQGGEVSNTLEHKIPAGLGDGVPIAYGVSVSNGSDVTFAEGIIIQGSQQKPVLIDGSTGSFRGKLSGNDASVGIIIQGAEAKGFVVSSGTKTSEVAAGSLPVPKEMSKATAPTGP